MKLFKVINKSNQSKIKIDINGISNSFLPHNIYTMILVI